MSGMHCLLMMTGLERETCIKPKDICCLYPSSPLVVELHDELGLRSLSVKVMHLSVFGF